MTRVVSSTVSSLFQHTSASLTKICPVKPAKSYVATTTTKIACEKTRVARITQSRDHFSHVISWGVGGNNAHHPPQPIDFEQRRGLKPATSVFNGGETHAMCRTSSSFLNLQGLTRVPCIELLAYFRVKRSLLRSKHTPINACHPSSKNTPSFYLSIDEN